MSFEQKNKNVKVGARSSNSKNLPFTLGIRNQLNLCYKYNFYDNINDDIILRPGLSIIRMLVQMYEQWITVLFVIWMLSFAFKNKELKIIYTSYLQEI